MTTPDIAAADLLAAIRNEERERVITELETFADSQQRLGLGEFNALRILGPMVIRREWDRLSPDPVDAQRMSVGDLLRQTTAALATALHWARPTDDPTSRAELGGCLIALQDAAQAIHGPETTIPDYPHLTETSRT